MEVVGTEFPEFEYTVSATKAGEFAHALGDNLRPLGDDLEVPVGMLFFVLAQDSGEIFQRLGVSWEQALFGGVRLEYRRPVRTGERLRGQTRCTECREHGEGHRRLAIIELQTVYRDDSGEEVLVETSTTLCRGGFPGGPG